MLTIWKSMFDYSLANSSDDGNQWWRPTIWISRVSLRKPSSSSWVFCHTLLANLFIRSDMGSIFSSACLSAIGQITGQYSWVIQRMALFWTIWMFHSCVWELMLRGTTGYVSKGRISALYSLTLSCFLRFLNFCSFLSSAFALFIFSLFCFT